MESIYPELSANAALVLIEITVALLDWQDVELSDVARAARII